MAPRSLSAYEAFVARLFQQNQFAIKYDLDAMHDAVTRLGLPPAGRRVVLVGGTNGKGRTVAHLNALACAAGLRVGLYTSPHLVSFRERIRVQGTPIGEEDVVRLGTPIFDRFSGQTRAAEGPRALSYFELTTLLAWTAFAEADLDLAIFEVGLGGRLDATNTVDPDVSVITGVSFDHMAYLGTTLEAIAGEKAGICRTGRPTVMHLRSSGAEQVAHAVQQRGGTLVCADGDVSPHAVATALAERAWETLMGGPPSEGLAAAARTGVGWPGRQHTLRRAGTQWWIDGAHNEEATAACADWLRDHHVSGVPAIVGLSPDRDPGALLRPLAPFVHHWHVVQSSSGRGLDAATLARSLPGASTVYDAPADAVNALRGSAEVLVTGSLYVVGDVFAALGLTADDLTVYAHPPDLSPQPSNRDASSR